MFPKRILIEAVKCVYMDGKGREEHVRKLLKDRSTYGDSPLHAALRYGQRNYVRYLLLLTSIDKECKMLVNGQNSSGKVSVLNNICFKSKFK